MKCRSLQLGRDWHLTFVKIAKRETVAKRETIANRETIARRHFHEAKG